MRVIVVCTACLLVSSIASAAPRPFIEARGTRLMAGDRPFRFVGANVAVMHGESERRDYARVLDAVRDDGLTVVRLWALGETQAPGKPYHTDYMFRIGQEGWVEDSFRHLDRVLAAARERGLRVIVVLANRWKDYGGIGTYLAWAGVPVVSDGSGHVLGTMLSSFYECRSCEEQYRAHVRRIIERTNTVTGVRYRDDPTILAWELINESSGVTARDEETLLAWTRRSARFVRSLDARHLIASGHIGFRTSRGRAVWRRVEALPEIDYADAHAYPLKDPRISNVARLARWIGDCVRVARDELKKPLVFGEFGFARTPPGRVQNGVRARWMRAFLDAARERGAAGSLVWMYEGGGPSLGQHSIATSGQDDDSLRVRQALREGAASLRAQPVANLEPLPSFDVKMSLRGALTAHRGFRASEAGAVLEIDPLAFSRARFERTGTYEEGPLSVVYGAGAGSIEYRFVASGPAPSALRVAARISSELPGFGNGEDFRDGSDVEITIDDVPIGVVRAKPDDGLGEVVAVELRDRRLLEAIFRFHRHTLRFRALSSHYGGGLCIYGEPTGVVPLSAPYRREIKAIRVTMER